MTASDSTKPEAPTVSYALMAVSLVVIGASIIGTAAACSLLAELWDPCSILSFAMLAPLCVFLGVQQYRGTFGANRTAAFQSCLLLAANGLLITLGVVSCLTVGTSDTWSTFQTWFVLIGVAIAVFCFGSCLMNFLWVQKLTNSSLSAKQQDIKPNYFYPGQWRLPDISAATAALVSVAVLTGVMIARTPPRMAEHVSIEQAPFGLPPEATDISFVQGYRGGMLFCEFSVTETEFVNWIHNKISSNAEYSASELNEIVAPLPKPKSPLLEHRQEEQTGKPMIVSGLEFEWSFEDRGVYALFDRDHNRGYYSCHSY